MKKISVIGAGNGGHAIAAYAATMGYDVCLYNRKLDNLQRLVKTRRIKLEGQINNIGIIKYVTDDIQFAVEYSDLLMITTTATAHKELVLLMSPYLMDNQIIILNPGRTGGLFEFKNIIDSFARKVKVYIGEAQTLVYACRLKEEATVNIIGIKDRVLISSDNEVNTRRIIKRISNLYQCFIPARNVLETSFENIGAIFHPCVVLFNAAAIERKESFYFYRDMTDSIANFINKLDQERISLGKAYNLELISAENWVSYAYPGIEGDNLYSRMKNNPAYYDILSPKSIFSRQLLEDIPTGLVPMADFARLANVQVTLMDSIITICSGLLNIDFRKEGRTLNTIGLGSYSFSELLELF